MSFGEYLGSRGADALRMLRAGNREAAIGHLIKSDRDICVEALSLLRDGLDGDAQTRLERWYAPKWACVADCLGAYEIAMGRACALPRVRL